jgi:hypothetical protein
MWEHEPIPSAELRAIELCRYSNLTYGTADPEVCASIVRGTPEYSYRGYCEWGVARERELLDAAVAEMRRRNALVLHTVVCAMLARERSSAHACAAASACAALEDGERHTDRKEHEFERKGPTSAGAKADNADKAGPAAKDAQALIARELVTLPSPSLRAVCRF